VLRVVEGLHAQQHSCNQSHSAHPSHYYGDAKGNSRECVHVTTSSKISALFQRVGAERPVIPHPLAEKSFHVASSGSDRAHCLRGRLNPS
jgi:hypothetical protein